MPQPKRGIFKKEKKRESALRDLAGNLLFVELIYCYKDIIIYFSIKHM